MDTWGWEHLRPWLELRIGCRWVRCCASSTGRPGAGRGRATPPARNCASSPPRPGCGAASRPTSCATPTPSSSLTRRPAQHHPALIGAHQPRRHLHLSAGDRQRRDRRHRPRPQRTDDPRQHRAPHLGRSKLASPSAARSRSRRKGAVSPALLFGRHCVQRATFAGALAGAPSSSWPGGPDLGPAR